MKLIINIPEEKYLYAKNLVNSGKENNPVVLAIGNGTPLPKGHGRLIDADEFISDIKKHYFDDGTVVRCVEIALDNAPTIIEADKETE